MPSTSFFTSWTAKSAYSQINLGHMVLPLALPLILCIAVSSAFTMPAYAQNQNALTTAQKLQPASASKTAKPVITAVTSAETFPYNFLKDGQVQGLAFDVTKALVEKAGYQLQIDIVPWPRALQLAQTESGTMIFSVARTAVRERIYHWIGPITTSEVWLYRLASRSDIAITELRDVNPYLIGDIAGNSTLSLLKSLGYKIDTAPSNISNCNKFKIGRVDLIPFDPNGIDSFLQTCGLTQQEVVKVLHLPRDTALYIGMSKNTPPDVVNQLQQTFASMNKDQSLHKIVQRWKPAQGSGKR